MPLNILPASIDILRGISSQTEFISTVFERESNDFYRLKEIFKSPGPLSQNEEFLSFSPAIRYFQIWLLLGLSMHGGMMLSPITHFVQSRQKFRAHWLKSTVSNEFTWGKFDTELLQFGTETLTRLFKARTSAKTCSASILDRLHTLSQGYVTTLKQSQKAIESITESVDSMSTDTLFILMSAFPSEDLNQLFLYIQQFFPDDLVIKSPNGIDMKLCALFQSPATDIAYLLEKLRIYFELYFSSKMPIITEITKSKTRDFISSRLKNPQFSTIIHKNLNQIKESQIDVRLNLYSLYDKHMKLLRP